MQGGDGIAGHAAPTSLHAGEKPGQRMASGTFALAMVAGVLACLPGDFGVLAYGSALAFAMGASAVIPGIFAMHGPARYATWQERMAPEPARRKRAFTARQEAAR